MIVPCIVIDLGAAARRLKLTDDGNCFFILWEFFHLYGYNFFNLWV